MDPSVMLLREALMPLIIVKGWQLCFRSQEKKPIKKNLTELEVPLNKHY